MPKDDRPHVYQLAAKLLKDSTLTDGVLEPSVQEQLEVLHAKMQAGKATRADMFKHYTLLTAMESKGDEEGDE